MLGRRAFIERTIGLGLSLGVLSACGPAHAATSTPTTPEPALPARARSSGGDLSLGNDVIEGRWSVADGAFRAHEVVSHADGRTLALPSSAFELVLADGGRIAAADMRIVSAPRIERLAPRRGASRGAERVGGRRVTLVLEDREHRVRATWRAELRDGSRYLRQEVAFAALGAPLAVREIVLVELRLPGAEATGTVKGSPVAAGPWFVGIEHPLSASDVDGDRVRCALGRELPLRPGAPFALSSVIGVTRPGQRRRDFLAYIERERAHPYRTFLHYNSWYDIGYFSRYDEAAALAAIDAFGTELARQRGVVLSSFLFDDGWDDPETLWGFNPGFPDGFTRVRRAAERYHAEPGVWMSPWGGYGKPKQERLAYGRAQGFETNDGGFALSGPKYYERFRDTCFRMVREYGVNQFKFDGTGNASSAFPGSVFDSDFDAAIALIGDLRAERPDIFINLTTGTYPSPFWLRYADSIWRGGDDHSFTGVGTARQRWITYRDADTYAGIVRKGALYPLNSLMLHGLIYARHAHDLDRDPAGDFGAEVRSYFGTGTQLQEMYITPALLAPGDWDTIAEAATWSRRNAGTLVDTHWIGGDPARLEPYGWASWSPTGGIVTLRNPGDRAQRFALDVGEAFELPPEAPRQFAAASPWARDRGRAPVMLRAGSAHVVELAPFEVVTLDAAPR